MPSSVRRRAVPTTALALALLGASLTGPALAFAAPAPVSAAQRTPDPDGSVTDAAWLVAGVAAAVRAEDARAGVLGASAPPSAAGSVTTVPGTEAAPEGAERVRVVRVQVEDGLEVDEAAFADFVMDVLNDPRGWGHDGSVAFERADGDAEISVVLASGALTDELCAPLLTAGQYSCGRNARAVLNAERWFDGGPPFLEAGGTLTEYREYLVNHEVGHLLGVPHTSCPEPGGPAPVMLQQSLRMEGCTPNGWPAQDP